ncbi:unnamed protein product [Paramecium octaurelia]|uniref:B box-type domain-containing protein n=1 Tax=Paramecium octaurelia TaxID=43137 RepID=A0A8S1SE77_PAROT|nr:unnamed protein product [Paramecium octaurelia]
MSHHMPSNPLIKQLCSNHPTEQFTNFCQNPECLKPLCPECIESHTKYHQQVQTSADIDSFKNVKQQCLKKISTGIQEIQKIIQDADQYGLSDIDDQTIREIRKGKEIAITLVTEHFSSLEEQYKSFLDQQSNSQQTFNQLQESIKNTMNELEHLNVGLESSNLIQFIKKICTMDLKKTLLKYKKTMKNLQNKSATQQIMVQLNQANIQHIQAALNNYAKLDFVPLQNTVFLSQSHVSQYQETYLQQNEYFRGKNKLLHFFETGKSTIWLYDLSLPDQTWRPVQISNYVEVLPYSKSIMTPDGQIYLTGGSLPNNKKSGKIYQFNFSNYQLQEVGQLTYGRSSHGLTWKNNELYLIGGYMDNLVITQNCEVFDCINKRTRRLPNLNYAIASPSVCIFNDAVTVAGGLVQNLKINQQIEFLMIDRWVPCLITSQYHMASMMCSIQIDQNQLMIFGGYYENNKGSKECMILEINETTAKVVETKQLPQPEGFWNNTPLIYQGRVWALQNVVQDIHGNCSQDQRRILIFDGQNWKST